MGIITWNTNVNAPFCPGEIVGSDITFACGFYPCTCNPPCDGVKQSILVQHDWDYPGVASSFGWSIREIQKLLADRALRFALMELHESIADNPANEADTLEKLMLLVAESWETEKNEPCEHGGTDGTIDCPDCGLRASSFIEAAGAWLRGHNGATADDPGYFQ